MTVLLSELLIPGWAEGPDAMIGTSALADASAKLPCHTAEPDLFFAEDNASISYAKSLCAACPMVTACLEGAISRAEPCGVWGGELFDEGRPISAKRSVGRPRLVALAS